MSTAAPTIRHYEENYNSLRNVSHSLINYKKLQDQELALLQPKTGKPSYLEAYKKLFDANAQFTDLRNIWQRVVNIGFSYRGWWIIQSASANSFRAGFFRQWTVKTDHL